MCSAPTVGAHQKSGMAGKGGALLLDVGGAGTSPSDYSGKQCNRLGVLTEGGNQPPVYRPTR
jgi:hypothetical protein